MAERLLGLSEVLLFGRRVEDLEIASIPEDNPVDLTERRRLTTPLNTANNPRVDGVLIADGMTVLVRRHAQAVNGIYTVVAAAWTRATVARNQTVFVRRGSRDRGRQRRHRPGLPAEERHDERVAGRT